MNPLAITASQEADCRKIGGTQVQFVNRCSWLLQEVDALRSALALETQRRQEAEQDATAISMAALKEVNDLRAKLAAADQARAEAEAWKESALRSFKDWHALADALQPFANLTIGDNIPQVLSVEIPKLLVARAEAEQRVRALTEQWRKNADMLAEGNKDEHGDPAVGMQRACADELDAALSLASEPATSVSASEAPASETAKAPDS